MRTVQYVVLFAVCRRTCVVVVCTVQVTAHCCRLWLGGMVGPAAHAGRHTAGGSNTLPHGLFPPPPQMAGPHCYPTPVGRQAHTEGVAQVEVQRLRQ